MTLMPRKRPKKLEKISRETASVVVDLKISQIVDRPNWTVTAYVPLSIFG